MSALRRWWPALPALAVAWLGLSSFVEKYPRPTRGPRAAADGSRGPDSLVAMVRSLSAADRAGAAAADTAAGSETANPFRPIRAPRPVASARPGGMTVPPPPRNYHLKGTVGSNVATIVGLSGARLIVRAGDRIDSAEVVSIAPNKVVLKDRAGRFEIQLER